MDENDKIKLKPASPIDDLTAALMTTIARKGRGFTLDTAAGSLQRLLPLRQRLFDAQHAIAQQEEGNTETPLNLTALAEEIDDTLNALAQPVIEVRESLKPHDEYEKLADWRDHALHDTESFIAYASRYGTKERSLVLFDKSKFTLVIDELAERGDRETIDMAVVFSPDWIAWGNMLNKPLKHRELLNFALRQEHNFNEGGVLASMQSMRINSVVNLESDIRDDGNNIGITIKTNAGEELRKFPKQFTLNLPVLEQDIDSDILTVAKIRLNIALPTEAKDGPVFTLYCSAWDQVAISRIRAEGDVVRKALKDWTVVHGAFKTSRRTLGA